jgi:membrane associated rhomboid family serine protease
MFPIRDHNPSGSAPVLTVALILINLAVFLATNVAQPTWGAVDQITFTWGMIPARLSAGQGYPTLFTSMFLHGSWLHLGGNMLFLWIFGDNLEDRMGRLGYLAFYLASGIAAEAAQWAADPTSRLPMVGASGAIAGVLGGYIWLYPRARVDVLVIFILFFRIFAVPAWAVLGFWFFTQLVAGAMTPADAGGVAYWAHVGGFSLGLGLTMLLLRRTAPPPPRGQGIAGPSVPLVRRRR